MAKVNGKVSDGVMSIINNSKINTQLSLGFQYNILPRLYESKINSKYHNIEYNHESQNKYYNELNRINQEYNKKCNAILYKYQFEKEKAKTKIAELKSANKDLQTIIDSLNINKLSDNILLTDSLNYEFGNNKIQIDSINYLLIHYPSKDDFILKIGNERAEEFNKTIPEVEVTGFNFWWLSINYKMQNNIFYLFNPNLQFENQVSKIDFLSHEISFQYSRYKWNIIPFASYFFDVGLSYSYKDNFSDLSKIEISEESNFGPNPNDRKSTSKYNAYVGDYKKYLKSLSLFGDFYYFLFKGNNLAIHFFPMVEQVFGDKKPVWNAGIGILFCFKSTKDESSIVNAELFCNFLDLFSAKESIYHTFERNNIGLRFSFPFNFKKE